MKVQRHNFCLLFSESTDGNTQFNFSFLQFSLNVLKQVDFLRREDNSILIAVHPFAVGNGNSEGQAQTCSP